MPRTIQPRAEISDREQWASEGVLGQRVEGLLAENARLTEECQALKDRVIELRRQANFYQRLHQRSKQREREKDQQIEALRSKVLELRHRVFGRKSERGKEVCTGSVPTKTKRRRGQQPGTAGHGRKVRKSLPVEEVEVLPPPEQIHCPRCNKPWERFGEPEVGEKIEWEVHIVRRRTLRPKFRRPQGCSCQDGRADIVVAPPPVSLIAKGLLGTSFIVHTLLLKFHYGLPMHRILRMAAGAGMPLPAGTLCGVFQRIAPLFVPLYEGILARSRQEPLALLDETRWKVFQVSEDPAGKQSHGWWLWVVATAVTRLFILSPSRSSEVPKGYFGFDEQRNTLEHHQQAMSDRYAGYAFLKTLLELAYCWAHVRRDFLEASRAEKDLAWALEWISDIGQLYTLNQARLELAVVENPARKLPAPFVEIDSERIKSSEYQQADQRLREAVKAMAATREEQLKDKGLRTPRRKILESLRNHWQGLTYFVESPQIPMDNNGAERAVRPAVIGRKNFYGSGSKWSGQLMAMLMSVLQTLELHQVDPRRYLSEYLGACASNACSAPSDITPWLPWNFAPSGELRQDGDPGGRQPHGPSP